MHLDNLPEFITPDTTILDMLTEAKVAITLCSPLIAHYMFMCEYHFTQDPRYQTAFAYVGQGKTPDETRKYVVFNLDFFTNILVNGKERAFVLMHEMRHIFQEHQGRQTARGLDHKLWNIATDHNINPQCVGVYRDENGYIQTEERYSRYISLPSKFQVLYEERFIGLSSDEIYHIILAENDDDIEQAIKAHGGEGTGGDEPSPIDFVPTNEMTEHQQANIKKGSATAFAKCSADKSIGESEAQMVNSITETFKPKISWKDKINIEVTSAIDEYLTYRQISNRVEDDDIVMPTMEGQRISVVYGIDSSGSMSANDHKDAASELRGVIDAYGGWDVVLTSCDTKAHEIGRYSSDMGDDFSTIDFNLVGGGGSSMTPILEHAYDLSDNGDNIDLCIIVTDGYIPQIDTRPYSDIKVIVVVTAQGNKSFEQNDITVIHID